MADPARRFLGPTHSANQPLRVHAATVPGLTRYADNLVTFGGGFDNTGAPLAGAAGLIYFNLRDASVPIYDVDEATTTINPFQNTTVNGQIPQVSPPNGDPIPWNPAWEPGPGNDRHLLIVNYGDVTSHGLEAGAGIEIWECDKAPNVLNYLSSLLDMSAHGIDPLVDPWLGVGVVYRYLDLFTAVDDTVVRLRGCGQRKAAYILRARDVQRAVDGNPIGIGHPIPMTIANPMFGLAMCTPETNWAEAGAGETKGWHDPRATRLEHRDPSLMGAGGVTLYDPTDEHRALTIPSGATFYLVMTDGEIDSFLDAKLVGGLPLTPDLHASLFAIIRAMCYRGPTDDLGYGMTVVETGGYGIGIETDGFVNPASAAEWAALGFVDDASPHPMDGILDGLLVDGRVFMSNPDMAEDVPPGDGAIALTGGFRDVAGGPPAPTAIGERWWYEWHSTGTGVAPGPPFLRGPLIPTWSAILGEADTLWAVDTPTVTDWGAPLAYPPFGPGAQDFSTDPGDDHGTPLDLFSTVHVSRRISGIATGAGLATLSTIHRERDVDSNLLTDTLEITGGSGGGGSGIVSFGGAAVVCLGTGEYSIDVVRRRRQNKTTGGPLIPGGPFLDAELEVVAGSWGRVLSKGSKAGITVSLDPACCSALKAIDVSTDELEIWRNTALVWAGPLLDVVDNRDGTVLFSAADSYQYIGPERRAIPRVWTGIDLATIFQQSIEDVLAIDDPGITFIVTPTGVIGTRIIDVKDTKVLGNFLAEIERTAVDWTITGRTWWIGGQEVTATTRLPLSLTDDDFDVPPKVRISRSAMATEVIIRGNGVIGAWGGNILLIRPDGVVIQKIVDENSIADQLSADAAAHTLWDRIHEPVTVIDGSNAQLNADSPIDIQTLIPGAIVPVSVGECLTFDGDMRLDSVDVKFDQTGEQISIGLQPLGTQRA